MRLSRACFLAAFLVSTAALAQTQPTPNSGTAALLRGLAQTKRIGDVALSPDGRTLAMVLAGELTVQPVAAGAKPHTVTACATGKSSISALSWSPDSTHLAILAECSGTPEVLLSTGEPGAKPKVLATLHGFAKALEYAPDGRSLGLLYVEGATRPSGALAAMKPPSGEIGVEGLEVQRVASIDAATGQLTPLTPPGLHVYEFSYAPDSRQLAFVAAAPPGENNWWIAKLYTEPVAGGSAPKVILDPNTVAGPLHGLQIAVPRWSPDGREVALIGGLMSDRHRGVATERECKAPRDPDCAL